MTLSPLSRRSFRHVGLLLSAVYLALRLLLSLFAPWISPYSPTYQDQDGVLALASSDHLLGADDLGRQALSRSRPGSPHAQVRRVRTV